MRISGARQVYWKAGTGNNQNDRIGARLTYVVIKALSRKTEWKVSSVSRSGGNETFEKLKTTKSLQMHQTLHQWSYKEEECMKNEEGAVAQRSFSTWPREADDGWWASWRGNKWMEAISAEERFSTTGKKRIASYLEEAECNACTPTPRRVVQNRLWPGKVYDWNYTHFGSLIQPKGTYMGHTTFDVIKSRSTHFVLYFESEINQQPILQIILWSERQESTKWRNGIKFLSGLLF